jgi:hypothetical protein
MAAHSQLLEGRERPVYEPPNLRVGTILGVRFPKQVVEIKPTGEDCEFSLIAARLLLLWVINRANREREGFLCSLCWLLSIACLVQVKQQHLRGLRRNQLHLRLV